MQLGGAHYSTNHEIPVYLLVMCSRPVPTVFMLYISHRFHIIQFLFSTVFLHNITITSSGVPTSGETYNLICTVEANVPLTVQWLYSSNGTPVVTSGSGITVRIQRKTGSTTTLTLSFNPLHTFHGGQYTCQSTTDTPPSTVNATRNVTVQSECI